LWFSDHEALVQYGIARFVDENQLVKIEEPLALVGILHYFDSMKHTIKQNIRSHLQVDKGLWFEEAVLLAVTTLLENPAKLSEIFEFHGQIPEWAHCSARIVTPHPDGTLPFSIDLPFDPSSIVAYSAKGPEDVTRWLEKGQEGWCIPDMSMGPDLIARLELDNGKRLVLFIQAKCRTTGNIETISAAVTADAIESLIPSKFFASSVSRNSSAEVQARAKEPIKRMLAAINGADSCWTGAEYNILRVVAAFPLAADLDSKSKLVATMLKHDKHPLATLSNVSLVAELVARPESKSCVDSLCRIAKKKHDEGRRKN